jgi:outer membrane protein TolC
VLGKGKGVPPTPREVAVGIPADLLRRRPDIRRAERQVAAQSARIGIAEADLYPRFSLNGIIGVSAEQFADLGNTPGSLFGSIGPAFRWDILNYGRILNNVLLQDARFQELAFDYQDQVLNAGREAEDAIVAFLRAQEQAERLADSVAAAQRTVQISIDQYREGAVDFTPVFLFQDILTEQQDLLTAAQGDIALNLIAVYRALGGGWEMRLSRDGNGQNGQHGPHGGKPGHGPGQGQGECVVIVETATAPAEVVPAQRSISVPAQHVPAAAAPNAMAPQPQSEKIDQRTGDASGTGGTP